MILTYIAHIRYYSVPRNIFDEQFLKLFCKIGLKTKKMQIYLFVAQKQQFAIQIARNIVASYVAASKGKIHKKRQ